MKSYRLKVAFIIAIILAVLGVAIAIVIDGGIKREKLGILLEKEAKVAADAKEEKRRQVLLKKMEEGRKAMERRKE